MNDRRVTNILLVVVVALLLGIIFRENIKFFFKAQEVLKRSNVLNIPDVAVYCYKWMIEEEAEPSPRCKEAMTSYFQKEKKWEALVKKYRDINCSDFSSRKEAMEFYAWISGEMAHEFYSYRKTIIGKEPDTDKFAYMSSTDDTPCRYDPYGLDTNGDCNPCEDLLR